MSRRAAGSPAGTARAGRSGAQEKLCGKFTTKLRRRRRPRPARQGGRRPGPGRLRKFRSRDVVKLTTPAEPTAQFAQLATAEYPQLRREEFPHVGRGRKRPKEGLFDSPHEAENQSRDRDTRLRAILRAPPEVQALRRDDLIGSHADTPLSLTGTRPRPRALQSDHDSAENPSGRPIPRAGLLHEEMPFVHRLHRRMAPVPGAT